MQLFQDSKNEAESWKPSVRFKGRRSLIWICHLKTSQPHQSNSFLPWWYIPRSWMTHYTGFRIRNTGRNASIHIWKLRKCIVQGIQGCNDVWSNGGRSFFGPRGYWRLPIFITPNTNLHLFTSCKGFLLAIGSNAGTSFGTSNFDQICLFLIVQSSILGGQ